MPVTPDSVPQVSDTEVRYIEVKHVDIDPEKRRKHTRNLSTFIKDELDARKPRESEWEKLNDQYKARSKRKDAGPRDSQLDMTITREKAIQARSRLINPITAYESIFVALETEPQYKDHAARYQKILRWIESNTNYLQIMHQSIEQAQIYPKTIVKVPWVNREVSVRYYEVTKEEEVNPETGDFIATGAMVERQKTYVAERGPIPQIIENKDFITPRGTEDPDTATWVSHRFETTRAEILEKFEQGIYRKDLLEVFGKNLERIGAATQDDEEWKRRFSTRYDMDDDSPKDYSKMNEPIYLYETYEKLNGKEVILTLDTQSGLDLRFVHNWNFDFPRPFAIFSWEEVIGDIEGVSFCQILRPLHKAVTAIFNQQLDAGSRALEKLIIGTKDCGLREYFENGRLTTGYFEVEDDMSIEKLREFNISSAYTPMPQLMEFLQASLNNVSSVADVFFGNEVASRPTATGTTAVIEEAKQPLFLLLERYRKFLEKIINIQFARYRQYYPSSMAIYVKSLDPQSIELTHELITWEEGYWRDQIAIETMVSSQMMSKTIRKQEIAAMVEKIPVMLQQMLQLSQIAGNPQDQNAMVAGKLLMLQSSVFKDFLSEYEVGGKEYLDVTNEINFGQRLQELISGMQSQISSLQSQVERLTAPPMPPGPPTNPDFAGLPGMGPGTPPPGMGGPI